MAAGCTGESLHEPQSVDGPHRHGEPAGTHLCLAKRGDNPQAHAQVERGRLQGDDHLDGREDEHGVLEQTAEDDRGAASPDGIPARGREPRPAIAHHTESSAAAHATPHRREHHQRSPHRKVWADRGRCPTDSPCLGRELATSGRDHPSGQPLERVHRTIHDAYAPILCP